MVECQLLMLASKGREPFSSCGMATQSQVNAPEGAFRPTEGHSRPSSAATQNICTRKWFWQEGSYASDVRGPVTSLDEQCGTTQTGSAAPGRNRKRGYSAACYLAIL